MLIIQRTLLEKIQAHLEAGYPHEACGILVGEIDFSPSSTSKTVRDVVLVKNAWDEDAGATLSDRPDGRPSQNESLHNRYLISPEDIARADRDAGKRGWDIIGFFHSHPDHPSRPSETDREWAWPVISFVITSVREGKATKTQSWVLHDDRDAFAEEEMHVDL